jgi:hypothetical protein
MAGLEPAELEAVVTWKQRLSAAFSAFCEGGVIAAGAIATTMAGDGLTLAEVKVLGSMFIAGGLSGVRMLFKNPNPPRDPETRERADD